MHAENRYPVTASLFMLKEIKHRQEQVNRGYQLLKRKAEAVRIRGRQAALELASTQAILGHTLREAYISLAAIKFTNGESNALVLENVGLAQVRVQRIPENISGVPTVALQALEDPGVGDALRYAGLGGGGHRTAEAKKAFREAVLILIKFASLRNTCILLDTSIRSTLRKVNGIEKVIMPKLRNTENYILMEMDEREREEFHRLKMVKAKKIRKQVRSFVRREEVTVGGGESTGMYHFNMVGVAMVGQMGHLFPPVSLASRKFNTFLSPMLIIFLATPIFKVFYWAMRAIYTRQEFTTEPAPLSIGFSTVEYFRTILACKSSLSMSSESGDFKPICLPHNWDDDDLLF